MKELKEQTAAIRHFNRFYTRIIGLVSEGINQSPYSLVEARVIHEIGRRETTTASELASTLQIDAGQLSRVVQKLVAKDILTTTAATHDRRVSHIDLTESGADAYDALNVVSDTMVQDLISPLSAEGRAKLVRDCQEIEELLAPNPTCGPLLFRPDKLGELGWLIHRQATLYNAEYGWNGEFETLIMQIYREYATHQTNRKSLWIAEQDNRILGSVFVLPAPDKDNVAQLRMLYVEPAARGRGLGHYLTKLVVDFAKDQGYRAITLWTQDCLISARKVYQSAGFKLIREEKHHSFGVDLNGQYWQCDL